MENANNLLGYCFCSRALQTNVTWCIAFNISGNRFRSSYNQFSTCAQFFFCCYGCCTKWDLLKCTWWNSKSSVMPQFHLSSQLSYIAERKRNLFGNNKRKKDVIRFNDIGRSKQWFLLFSVFACTSAETNVCLFVAASYFPVKFVCEKYNLPSTVDSTSYSFVHIATSMLKFQHFTNFFSFILLIAEFTDWINVCVYRLFWFQYKSQPYHFVEKYFFYYIQFSSVILSFSIHLKEENNKSPVISLSRIHFDESWTKINEIAWKWLDIKWVRESELLFIWYGVARFLYYLVFLSSGKAIYHFDEISSLNGLTPSTKSFFSFFLSRFRGLFSELMNDS